MDHNTCEDPDQKIGRGGSGHDKASGFLLCGIRFYRFSCVDGDVSILLRNGEDAPADWFSINQEPLRGTFDGAGFISVLIFRAACGLIADHVDRLGRMHTPSPSSSGIPDLLGIDLIGDKSIDPHIFIIGDGADRGKGV